ncbi:MAG: quinolinate synthase NadA [Acidobacteriota bacterium]
MTVAALPEIREIPQGFELEQEILRLKKERNAVLLCHYYPDAAIQDLADFVGDSLELSRAAQRTQADVIVFAGVKFMAETAKILNPTRRVVLPDMEAGCSLAEGCPADAFAAFRAAHPEHVAVTYINCSVEIKALSDVICTSSNALKIIQRLPDKPILFAPDRNLGAYLRKQSGRDLLLWNGICIVHEIFSERRLLALKVEHPDALVLAHPECEEGYLRHADHVGSTSSILRYASESPGRKFIVATEAGIIHQMKKANPGKEFIAAPPESACGCNECPHMKKNTLEKVYLALRDLKPEITIPEDLRIRALRPLERMFELTA